MKKLGRSLYSCIYIYVQIRVLHMLCVTTKKLQFISILFFFNKYMQPYLCMPQTLYVMDFVTCIIVFIRHYIVLG